MTFVRFLPAFAVLAWALPAAADEPGRIADSQRAILADYQRILAATDEADARGAAARLARAAYAELLQRAADARDLTADDLRALAACHESLGQTDKAIAHYEQALEKRDEAGTHLALARMLLPDDLRQAEEHFTQAAALQPGHPELPTFHLRAAQVLSSQRNWKDAARHLEQYVGYAKVLADRGPASGALQQSYMALGEQLDRIRRYAGMMNQPAAPIDIEAWVQGEPATLADLKGKVALIDFFAVWAEPSRRRIETLKKLYSRHADSGLEIVGVTLSYQFRYDAQADTAELDRNLSPEDECQGLAAFAGKHAIAYPLGVVPRETTETYGVATLPYTVLLDRQGNVRMILLAGDSEDDELLEAEIAKLLESPVVSRAGAGNRAASATSKRGD